MLWDESLVLAAIRPLPLRPADTSQPAPKLAQEPVDLLGRPRWLGKRSQQPPLLGVAHHVFASLFGDPPESFGLNHGSSSNQRQRLGLTQPPVLFAEPTRSTTA